MSGAEQVYLWFGFGVGILLGLAWGWAFWRDSREAWYWARRIKEERDAALKE